MLYRQEFPDFDFEVPARVTTEWGFEDVSCGIEPCPRFECDVFVLWIDYNDQAGQFTMVCEGEIYLETDSWEDVRAFVEDGKRDFG